MEQFDITTLLHGGSETLNIKLNPKEDIEEDDEEEEDEPTEEEYKKMDEAEEAELARLQTKTFQDILKDFSKQPKDILQLRIPLEGLLDFKEVENISTLQSIVFEKPGKVTQLRNLPNRLVELHVPEQQIQDLGILPKSLQILDAPNNRLVQLDLKNANQLLHLNVNDNMLKSLDNIPLSLRHLRIEGNQLETLDLTGIPLEILHVSYNQKKLHIFGLPANLEEFQHDNTQMETEENIKKRQHKSKRENTIPVKEALEHFYRLKGEYSKKSWLNKRARTKNDKSPIYNCIVCRQTGQMVFEQNENHLLAKCGHVQSPCQLHIELDKGIYTHLQTYRDYVKQEYDKIAEEIILIANKIKFGYPLKPTDKKKEQDALEWKKKWETVDALWKEVVEDKKTRDEMQRLERETKEAVESLQEQYRLYRESSSQKMTPTHSLREIVKQQLETCDSFHRDSFRLQYKHIVDFSPKRRSFSDFLVYDGATFIQDYSLHNEEPKVIALELNPDKKKSKKIPTEESEETEETEETE